MDKKIANIPDPNQNRNSLCRGCCAYWPAYLNMLDAIFLLGFSFPIKYVGGWSLAIVWLVLHIFTLFMILIMKFQKKNSCQWATRISQQKFCIYVYQLISVIIFGIMILIFFLFVFQNKQAEFPSPCDNKSNACTRVSPWEKHRAEDIQMKLPVTFINKNITRIIQEWFDQEGYSLVKSNITASSQSPNQYHYQKNLWWGMITDFYLMVSNCSDVQGAQRVLVQSQNRLGFKDYHENPQQVTKLYETINNRTDIKSLLFCQ